MAAILNTISDLKVEIQAKILMQKVNDGSILFIFRKVVII